MNSLKLEQNIQAQINNRKQRQKQRQRSRSRDKLDPTIKRMKAGQMNYHQFLQKEQQFHANQQILRSFLRIQQGRQQPIDKFVKVLYTYKGKYEYDNRLIELMNEPKKYLNRFNVAQLESMIVPAKRHLQAEEKQQKQGKQGKQLRQYKQQQQKQQQQQYKQSKYVRYWRQLIKLIEYKIMKKQQKQQQINRLNIDQSGYQDDSLQNLQMKQKIKTMMNKSNEELIKLNKKIQIMLKNSSFGVDMSYWEKIKSKVKGKLIQLELKSFYQEYKENVLKKRQNQNQHLIQEEQLKQTVSPILQPYSIINPKFLVTQQEQREQRQKLNQIIFREQFEKSKEKLQTNLSLPKNHNLLTKDFVTQSSKTYDLITQEIMEFEKYKRMEDDEEEFDDWVPIQTQGRFRDRKPEYINRVRVSFDQKKYGMSGIIKQRMDEKQPPAKQVQGYKFNIFYPDLFDKEKTPQYYLQELEDPNYCLIKFKAGPPYKDIGFKILRKQWDFTQKSGFEAIFTKGILQLYFNFKKPKYRI